MSGYGPPDRDTPTFRQPAILSSAAPDLQTFMLAVNRQLFELNKQIQQLAAGAFTKGGTTPSYSTGLLLDPQGVITIVAETVTPGDNIVFSVDVDRPFHTTCLDNATGALRYQFATYTTSATNAFATDLAGYYAVMVYIDGYRPFSISGLAL